MKTANPISFQNKCKGIIGLLILCLLPFVSFCVNETRTGGVITGKVSNISGGTYSEAVDDKYSDMDGQTSSDGKLFTNYYNKRLMNRIYVSVNYKQLNVNIPLSISVSLSIIKTSYNTSTHLMTAQSTISKTISLNYNPSNLYSAQRIISYDNGAGDVAGYKIRATINSISVYPTSVNPEITLYSEIETERYYTFQPTFASSQYNLTKSSSSEVQSSSLLKIGWEPATSVNVIPEEFDLEWVYVDNYPSKAASEVEFNPEIFDHNSTRITTKNRFYLIPVVYTHGFIVYRLRSYWKTAFDSYNNLVPSAWSTDITFAGSCTISPCYLSDYDTWMYFQIGANEEHEPYLNWQFNISFAEEGKSSLQVNYFDGSLRSRQSVTKAFKNNLAKNCDFDNSTIASEIIYDHQGRPAINTLPVPTDVQKIGYNRFFNRYYNTSTSSYELYSRNHFDLDVSTCQATTREMSNYSGSSKYFSPNHSFPPADGKANGSSTINCSPHPEELYIPDAKNYPFTQNVYSPDNTGRIKKQSGVGLDYTIGSGKETRYFYGKPFQEELDALFGYEAGVASHYNKNMVIDANGQISVSFIDPTGKTIATSLAGVKPLFLQGLSNSQTYTSITVDLLNKISITGIDPGFENRLDLENKRRILTRELLIDTKQPYYLGYELQGARYSTECEGASTICYDCVLNLNISLTDECGVEYAAGIATNGTTRLTSTIFGQSIIDQIEGNTFSRISDCTSGNSAISPLKLNLNTAGNAISGTSWVTNTASTTPYELNVGNYSLKKILTVNQKALDFYTKDYLASSCNTALEYFTSQELAKANYLGCNITCDNCQDQLGSYDQYDCDNPAHDPKMPCMTLKEFQTLLSDCDRFCKKSIKCEAAYANMLTDMSPHGQYGQVISGGVMSAGKVVPYDMAENEINPTHFQLSVFNEGNLLPRKTAHRNKGLLPNWRYPYIPYQNEFNEDDFVEVKLVDNKYVPDVTNQNLVIVNADGTFKIRPQHLGKIKDFINVWKPSWAASLVYYHPEYPNYELCIEQSASNEFDAGWSQVQTYADAVTKYGVTVFNGVNVPNFFNPLGSSAATSIDPYFKSDNPRYNYDGINEYTAMKTSLEQFLYDDQSASWISIWSLAYRIVMCPDYKMTCNTTCANSFDYGFAIPVPLPGTLTTKELDMVWNNFKGIYLSLKQRFEEKKFARIAIKEKTSYNGCIGQDPFNPNNFNFIHTPGPLQGTTVLWPSWFSQSPLNYYAHWSQFYNFEQPCSWSRFEYYKKKVARFPGVTSLTNISGYNYNFCYNVDNDRLYVIECKEKAQAILNEARSIVDLALFKQCGKCPLAGNLELLINSMLTKKTAGTTPDLLNNNNGSGINITCNSGENSYKELTKELFDAMGGIKTDGFKWHTTGPQLESANNAYSIEGTFKNNSGTNLCTMKLQFPDGSNADGVNFDDVIGFCCLKYISNPAIMSFHENGNFTITAIITIPHHNSYDPETKEIVLEGYTTCLDIANCTFTPICKPSTEAKDLETLFNLLLSDKISYNPNPPTPPTLTAFTKLTTPPTLKLLNNLNDPNFYFNTVPGNKNLNGISTYLRYALKNAFNLPDVNSLWYWSVISIGTGGSSLQAYLFNDNSYASAPTSVSSWPCTINFFMPTTPTYSVEDIISFSNITPDYENLPHGFLITALVSKTVNGVTTTEYITVKGDINYITIGSCNNEVPAPYMMGASEPRKKQCVTPGNLIWFLTRNGNSEEHPTIDKATGALTFGEASEGTPCDVILEMPPLPGYTFEDIDYFVEVQPDPERPSPEKKFIIVYAKMKDGIIIPFHAYINGIASTCILDCAPCNFNQLIPEGNFNDQADWFDTDFSLTTSECLNPGDYYVVSGNVPPVYTNCSTGNFWNGIQDHTQSGSLNSGKYFMISRSNGDNEKLLFSKTISTGIDKGNEYLFQLNYLNANIAEADKNNIIRIEFNRPTGNNDRSHAVYRKEVFFDPDHKWHELNFIWPADADGPLLVEIFIEENNDNNYVAIDDISIGRHCGCEPFENAMTGQFTPSSSTPPSYFSSDISYKTTAFDLSVEAYKVITTFTDNSIDYKDHSAPNNGSYLALALINQSISNNVWTQEYNVEPGKEYTFNAWYFCNYTSGIKITLKVNGQIIQEFTNGNHIDEWYLIEGRWHSEGNQKAEVSIYIEKLVPSSQVIFAGLDDIGFVKMCMPSFCKPSGNLTITYVNPCETQLTNIANHNAWMHFTDYMENKKKEFQTGYIAKCLNSYETFLMKYDDGAHHTTLYYYDQAGNLVRTIPPEGVRKLDNSKFSQIKLDRSNDNRSIFTSHLYPTTYQYNSLNQLMAQTVPDHEDLNILKWEDRSSGIANNEIKSLSFSNKYGGAVSIDGTTTPNNGKIYYTDNYGASWSGGEPKVGFGDIIDIFYESSTTYVYAINKKGKFLFSNNGGISWKVKNINTTKELVKMAQITNLTIYCNDGSSIYTTDYGDTWNNGTAISISTGSFLTDINYYDNSNGTAVTSKGDIYYTSNGGSTWTVSNQLRSLSINTVQRVNNYLTIAGGLNGLLLKSTDNGTSWQEIPNNLTTNIKDMFFRSTLQGTEGTLLDEVGDIYRSIDAGKTWNKLNVTSSGLPLGPYTDIDFISGTEGRIIDFNGNILLTNNGGLSWSTIKTTLTLSSGITIIGLHFPESSHGFCTGSGGEMYHTTNNGISWTAFTFNNTTGGSFSTFSPGFKEIHITPVDLTNKAKGAILTSGGVLYSFDINLSQPTAPTALFVSTPAGTLTDFNNLQFINDNDGYSVTKTGRLGITSDAGVSWSAISATTSVSVSTGSVINDVWMENSLVTSKGIVVGTNGELWNTTDRGANNTDRSEKVKPVPLNGVYMSSSSVVYSVGEKGECLKSTNGGVAWKMLESLNTANDLYDIKTLAGSTSDVYAAGTNNYLVSTGNGGNSWISNNTNIVSGETIFKLAVHPSGTNIAASGSLGNIYLYTGSASTAGSWHAATLAMGTNPITSPIRALYLGTQSFAGSAERLVTSTTMDYSTGANTWANAIEIKVPELNDIFIVNSSLAYAVGENGTILKTNNFGAVGCVWESQLSGTDHTLNGVAFANQDKGVAVGNDGLILTTNNGGVTWNIIDKNTTSDFKDVYVVDESFAVIVGEDKKIFKNLTDISSATGSFWVSEAGHSSALSTDHFNGVHFVDRYYGIVVGDNGSIFRVQINSSGTWTWDRIEFLASGTYTRWPQHLGLGTGSASTYSYRLNKVFFKDYVTGYIVGDNGLIIKTANSCSTFVSVNPATPITTRNVKAFEYCDFANIFVGTDLTTFNGNPVKKMHDENDLYSTKFYYDRLGRIIASQNSRQRSINENTYSFTIYDGKGRIIHVGQIIAQSAIQGIYDLASGRILNDGDFLSWVNHTSAVKSEVTQTFYDDVAFTLSLTGFTQDNLRNRVVTTTYEETYDGDDNTYDMATHYSYDIHGNVKCLVQEYDNIANLPTEARYKRIDYDYDLISGKVNKVSYQGSEQDQFYHKYEYDAQNRLTNVFTSTDNISWQQDASYNYYRHGPLARVEIGQDKVQGMDYAYTIQGWLKGVNSNTVISPVRDIGKDGYNTFDNPNSNFARDEFGFSLNYYQQDYSSINTPNATTNFLAASDNSSSLHTNSNYLYNGNISQMVTAIRQFMQDGYENKPQAMVYSYDQLNRLRETQMVNDVDINTNTWVATGTNNNYKEQFTYDANGNIMTLNRYGIPDQNGSNSMDQLEYKYLNTSTTSNFHKNTNKLAAVYDNLGSTPYIKDDIENGQAFSSTNHSTDNYQYDGIGNLIKDVQEEIANIEWNTYGKIKKITRSSGSTKPDLEFLYDPSGNRVCKINKPAGSNSSDWIYTIYVRDAQGNILSDYSLKGELYKQQSDVIYGSSRLGEYLPNAFDNCGIDEVNVSLFNSIVDINTWSDQYLGAVLGFSSEILTASYNSYTNLEANTGMSVDQMDKITLKKFFTNWSKLLCKLRCFRNLDASGYSAIATEWENRVQDIHNNTLFNTFNQSNWNTAVTGWEADEATLIATLATNYTNDCGNTYVKGSKHYELANHLGNVMAVISDRKVAQPVNIFNDDFSTAGTAWVNNNGVPSNTTLTYSINALSVLVNTSGSGVARKFATVPGDIYKVNLTNADPQGNTFRVSVKDAAGNILEGQLFNTNLTTSFYFIAQSTQTGIYIEEAGSTSSVTFVLHGVSVDKATTSSQSGTAVISDNFNATCSPTYCNWSSTQLTLSINNQRLKATTTSPGSNDEVKKTITLTSGSTYHLHFYAELSGVSVGNMLVNYKDNNSTIINSSLSMNSTGWYDMYFTAVGTDAILSFNVANNSNAYTFYIDDITLTETTMGDAIQYKANVINANDYYAFGSPMPGRNFQQFEQKHQEANTLLLQTFDDPNTNTWSINAGTPTMNIGSNRMQVDFNGASESILQTISTIIGRSYKWIIDVDNYYQVNARLRVEDNASGMLAGNIDITANGLYTLTFTAQSTTSRIIVESQTTGTLFFDNIKVIDVTDEANGNAYRFSFNGKEKDDETYGGGNAYDFGARIYDPRLGRFLSVDPIFNKYPFVTPYNFAQNKPIRFIDILGYGPGDVVVFFPGAWLGQGMGGDGTSALTQSMLKSVTAGEVLTGGAFRAFPSGYKNIALGNKVDLNFVTDEAYTFIKANYKKGGQVVIYGFSWGGNLAQHLAERLKADNITVDLLVTVDQSAGSKESDQNAVDRAVPDNVKKNINYYQTIEEKGTESKGAPNTADDPNKTEVININLTNQPAKIEGESTTVTHHNIPLYTRLPATASILRAINKNDKK